LNKQWVYDWEEIWFQKVKKKDEICHPFTLF
jgi:hypothetical protein